MSKTRHIQKRMSQRAIRQSYLELVKTFGIPEGDKVILNRKGIDAALREMKAIASNLQKMRPRGGVVLVEEQGSEITTYTLESYSREAMYKN